MTWTYEIKSPLSGMSMEKPVEAESQHGTVFLYLDPEVPAGEFKISKPGEGSPSIWFRSRPSEGCLRYALAEYHDTGWDSVSIVSFESRAVA